MDEVLNRVHHLLNGLLNICMEQRFVTATMNVIECSQLFTQSLWFHSNQLLQVIGPFTETLSHSHLSCVALICVAAPALRSAVHQDDQ